MARNETQVVVTNALDHIVQHGAQLARDNRTVKNHLFNFSNHKNYCITNHLIIQSGAQIQSKIQKAQPQPIPVNLKKDIHSFYFVNSSPSKNDQKSKNKIIGISTRETATQRSSRNNLRSQFLSSRKLAARTPRQQNQNRFVDLSDILKQPDNGKKITQAMKNQQKRIQSLRQKIIQQQKMDIKQRQQKQRQQKMNNQRIQNLKIKLHKHLKDKNNSFSFDNNGEYLLVSHETHKKAIKKRFPPSNLHFTLDQPQQPKNPADTQINIKQKAAKGQAFASSILKTMNMSKFSLNLTTKTCNIDQFAFMKRNDLFNNNHSRQVTTIPFLQVSQGTNYTQTHTNVSVNKKKTQRTAYSERKGKFKTHNLYDHWKQNSQNHNAKTQIVQPQNSKQQVQKRRRIQSSKPYVRRPKTSVPMSARVTDRITSVNQHLIFQLIE